MTNIEWALLTIIPFALFAVGGAAVYAVFVWRNTDRRDEVDPGIGTPRRVYFYLASFVSLMMAASGAATAMATLLDSAFRAGGADAYADSLAMGLALVAVGLPVWLFHWRFVQRAAARTPSERRSVLRNLHVYTALGVALGFIGFSAFRVVQFALFAGAFDGFAWGGAPVWGAVWAYHWRVASAERAGASDETLAIRRMYLYTASAVALAAGALGVAILARVVLLDGYQTALGITLAEDGIDALGVEARSALAAALVGGVGWATHWLMFARGDRRSVLRWAYLLIAALGGGFGAMVVGFGYGLYAAMQWAVDAVEGSLAEHLATLPTSMVVIAVAAAIWRHHRNRIWPEAGWSSLALVLARIYMLALAAMGLLAVALALAAVADALLLALAERGGAPFMREFDNWGLRDRMAYIVTLLSIGCPLWWISWRQAQEFASESPQTERDAPVLRMYALGVLCLGLMALIGGASAALYTFLSDLLADGALSAATLRELALPMSAVLPPAVILPYHWIVYRRERAFEPEPPDAAAPDDGETFEPKQVTLIAPPEVADALATALASALGYPVEITRWSDSQTFTPLPDEGVAAAAARAIAESPEMRALVVPERGGLRVIWRD